MFYEYLEVHFYILKRNLIPDLKLEMETKKLLQDRTESCAICVIFLFASDHFLIFMKIETKRT